MSNLKKKSEIIAQKNKVVKISVAACTLGIAGIILSPSIPITVAVTAIASGAGYIGIKKIDKLNEAEKSL